MASSARSATVLTLLTVTTLITFLPTQATAEPASGPGTNYAIDDPFTSDRTAWWRDGRFGMFIHFGAYSHLEGEYTRPDGSVCRGAEWIQRECAIPKEKYEDLAATFNPADFNAETIAQAAQDAGQKYIVITSKHHDGYAMWPTEVNDWNLRDHSSFDRGRDILAELKAAADKRGIKFGVYYSIWDWHDPDMSDPATFPNYEKRMYAQLKELVDNYDPAVLWFDGEWTTDRPNNPWTARDGERLESYVRDLSPDTVVNNRVGKRRVVDGDYSTPEQNIPAGRVAGHPWETCMTLNDTWGFAKWDHNWKSSKDVTRKLIDIASRSGNYLLNIGPDARGRVPEESVTRLREMGTWLRANGDAVRDAGATGLVADPAWGAVSSGHKGKRLYVSVNGWPDAGGSLRLDALAPFSIASARVLGSDQPVSVRRDGDVVTLTPSGGPTNDVATVIELVVDPSQPGRPAKGAGLTAQFWPNGTFTGDPTVNRTDKTVNYNWKFTGSPDPSVPAESFSSRWTGQIEAPHTGTYTFTTVSDDTVRLWVNDKLVIDNTRWHGPTVDRGTIALEGGKRYPIKLEHTEQGGEAAMKLIWSSPYIDQQVVPSARLYPN